MTVISNYTDHLSAVFPTLWFRTTQAVTTGLKDKFTQTSKFRHYLFTSTLMESRVKFCSPQNISGASQ